MEQNQEQELPEDLVEAVVDKMMVQELLMQVVQETLQVQLLLKELLVVPELIMIHLLQVVGEVLVKLEQPHPIEPMVDLVVMEQQIL